VAVLEQGLKVAVLHHVEGLVPSRPERREQLLELLKVEAKLLAIGPSVQWRAIGGGGLASERSVESRELLLEVVMEVSRPVDKADPQAWCPHRARPRPARPRGWRCNQNLLQRRPPSGYSVHGSILVKAKVTLEGLAFLRRRFARLPGRSPLDRH